MASKSFDFKATKYACYYSYVSGAAVFALPAILFTTFREMYNISYTLLGTLVLVNFTTQLIIDLIFTTCSKYFNIKKTVVTMPVLTSLGLIVYAVIPTLFPQNSLSRSDYRNGAFFGSGRSWRGFVKSYSRSITFR